MEKKSDDQKSLKNENEQFASPENLHAQSCTSIPPPWRVLGSPPSGNSGLGSCFS